MPRKAYSISMSCRYTLDKRLGLHYYKLAGRHYAQRQSFTTQPNNDNPVDLLDRLHDLASKINATPSKLKKDELVRQYPCCYHILRRIYDPHIRHWVTSKSVIAYLQRQDPDRKYPPPPKSLAELLDTLSSRRVTGHAALETVSSFYREYCKTKEHQQIFWRVLDKNLKMGLSVRSLRPVLEEKDTPTTNIKAHGSRSSNSTKMFSDVALAMAMTPSLEKRLFEDSPQRSDWYASRKLDGVRCITFITRQQDGSSYDIRFFSRTGRTFDTLEKVESNILTCLNLHRPQESFVLDGEICVYPPGEGPLEDFLETLRQIRNRNQPMENPVYEIFDMVSMEGFISGKEETMFAKRQQRLANFLIPPQYHIRMVPQVKVTSLEMLSEIKKSAIESGWEGLIVRKDTIYEGKRR